jgi:hypothetical protein
MMDDGYCPCGFPANDPTSTHTAWHNYWEHKQAFERRTREEKEARFEQLIGNKPGPAAEQPTLL